jgi:hypothetical protein
MRPVPLALPVNTNCLSENRRGLAHFAIPCEQYVPVPFSADGSWIGSRSAESQITAADGSQLYFLFSNYHSSA